MSDSSEEEDLSRFKDSVDITFTKLINEARGDLETPFSKECPTPKSERYLEIASHYNDVKVPEEMQKNIGAKVSAIIHKNTEFVDVPLNGVKKHKIKGGVKLFSNSDLLSTEEVKDVCTEIHNKEAKRNKIKQKQVDEVPGITEEEKISTVAVSGDYILSKKEIKCYKSRRKEQIYKYKQQGKSNVLTLCD